jgi:trk system potassium uptake protein TrkH
MTAVVEGVGVALLFVTSPHPHGAAAALGASVFHAVSAFCNAGFSVYPDNLAGPAAPAGAVATIAVLVVLGGLGHIVLQEVREHLADRLRRRERRGPRRLSTHTRLVLLVSGVLVLAGTAGLAILGTGPRSGGMADRLGHALFQSVTARTAGFNTVSIGAMPAASLLLVVLLMFVGGSPGSCAGGIKTTSLAIWVARLRAGLRGDDEVRLLDRRVPGETLDRVSSLVGLAVLWNLIGVAVLLVTEHGATLQSALFEQVSAFGTVGLSTGLTPRLSAAGRLWIVSTMFVGRLGPLTLAARITGRGPDRVRHPPARIMIG